MLKKAVKAVFSNHLLFTISIRSRLLLYFIFLALLPTSIISITLYYKSTGIITEKTNSALEEKLNIISDNILQKLDSIYDASKEIYLNTDVVRILSADHPASTTDIINEMSVLDKLLENYTVTDTARDLIIPKMYIYNRPEYMFYRFTDKVSDTSIIETEKWYMNLPYKADYTIIGTDSVTVSSKNVKTVKIAVRLFGLDDMSIRFGGVLLIDAGADYFNNILNKSKPTIGSSIFILNSSRSILTSPDASLPGKDLSGEKYIQNIFKNNSEQSGSFIETINRSNMLVSYKRIEGPDWTIVSLTPMSEINGELISFNRVIVIVVILSSMIAIFMALLLSDNISYPIRKLVKSMSEVQNNNFDISLEYIRNDEFAYLFNSYKTMLHNIKELIEKLYVSEVRKKEVELKSLQAQINPHFLYNTLDSVNWMALELKAADISTMVTSLSNFFRYSLSKGKNIISLEDEKTQVESYLKIQAIRFKEKLDYHIDFSGDILGFLSVKLILQPVVENSILHGINKRSGKGTITITGKKIDSVIEIDISDDGVGADVEELNAILDDPGNSSSFAIKNVNDRIRHYFGKEYGLRFHNHEGPGTTVIIRFPAVKTMEGLYVEDDYRR
jgi:two-component system, sensor histidine kinase YesM